ncbi:hypothetical protein C8N25_10810 [Algoriphagus antarcticus]|uniref:Uncharacterized protein n=1 Tax=Algoriphagus antarcticus TaxID=238540 RepID=A0A3E0DVF4_9BACT|nr:hypothetical protein C8N25_10810 [Algoriphagus antarcticus]
MIKLPTIRPEGTNIAIPNFRNLLTSSLRIPTDNISKKYLANVISPSSGEAKQHVIAHSAKHSANFAVKTKKNHPFWEWF